MSIKRGIQTIFYIFTFVALMAPGFAFAQDSYGVGLREVDPKKLQIASKPGADGVRDIFITVIKFALGFLAALAVLVIIIAGIIYITSGGDEDRVQSAKGWLLYAIVGLVIALLGWVIVSAVSDALIAA